MGIADRVLGTLLVISLVAGLLLSLLNPATFRLTGYGNVRSGAWADAYQSEYEEQFPLRDPAAALWTTLRYIVFGEGRRGVLVGEGDWLFSAEEFGDYPDRSYRIDAGLAIVRDTHDRLQRRGIELVVVLVPAKARIYPQHLGRYRFPDHAEERYRSFRAALLDLGIPVPDLEAALFQARAEDEVFLQTDTHWTPHGARAAAAAIAAAARPILDRRGSPRVRFRLEEQPQLHYRGDLLNFLPLGPFAEHVGPQAESVRQYRAREVDAAAVGLFDELVIPVTLVGTSYSAGEVWNFEAFLKTELEADLLNLAQEGQGPFAPMRDYLDGPTIDDVRPDLLIWEIPERYLAPAN